ncbi:MAG: PKD domain-containing protein [Bacteroidetes bacterium]|nr:PKD domain-containing protein [Bacteroidota bacterium]
MGRICLLFAWLTFSALQLSAQSGGYSYLEFVENKGQWDSSVLFRAQMAGGVFLLRRDGFTVVQHDTGDLRRISQLLHGGKNRMAATAPGGGTKTVASAGFGQAPIGDGGGSGSGGDPFLLHSHSYRVSFENGSTPSAIVPEKPQPTYNNYIYGDRKSTRCRIFQSVTFKDIYPGIDIRYYANEGVLKYDLVVHPGADPSKIVLNYQGQTGLSIKKNQLLVKTTVGTIRELEPLSYQTTGKGRSDVQCRYVVKNGNKVSFDLGEYSSTDNLIIDPVERFCSFTGSRSDNWGYTATYDNAGDFYAGGITLEYPGESGNLFGVTAGAYQSTFKGGDGSEGYAGVDRSGNAVYYNYDIAIMKFNPGGTVKMYATYLGGTGDEQPHSMVCDPQGNLILTGRTSSGDFPPGATAKIGNGGGFDLFVSKLSADGSTLLGGKRIGGASDEGVNNSPKYVNAFGEGAIALRLNYGDDGRSEVILDNAGNIYVAACVRPARQTGTIDFPVTGGAFQTSFGGGDQDGVLLKMTPDANNLLFASYLGGNSTDAAFVLALDPATNNIYVAGGTKSNNFPGTGNGGVLQPSQPGGIDGFVSVVSNDGSTLVKSTYFGTSKGTDMLYGISFDRKGQLYITGTTTDVIPVVNSPFNQGGNQASGKQFITKLQPNLTSIVYSANFGPGNEPYPCISPTAFLVDRCENVYVSGWGGGIDVHDHYANSGVTGLTTTNDAMKKVTDRDSADFYFFVLQKNASAQLYGSFFGQSNGRLGDHVDGGTSRFDDQGVIYQAICANCDGPDNIFPTTSAAIYQHNGALSIGGCNEAAVKIAFQFAGVAAGLKTTTHGRGDSVGCIPLTVTLQDTISNAKSYIWNFGDGSAEVKTTSNTIDHTYTAVGDYTVMLVAIDSNSCNVADTSYRVIEARNNPAFLDFRYDKIGPCDQYNYIFTNLSTHGPGAPNFVDTSFTWNFGDGSPVIRSGVTDQPTHTFSPGTYNVVLSLVDTNYCNYPTDTIKMMYVTQNVKAQFETPPVGCAPYTAVFKNTSVAGQKFYWNFGDGSPIDSSLSPSHLYTGVGIYNVTLTAIDSATCNIVDVYSFTITVRSKPVAEFTYTPLPPQPPNTPTIFTDASTPGVKYEWTFGDGASAVKTTPDTVIHQYNKTDTFRACLVVTNDAGCTDTVCHLVPAVVNPLLDVPNAFTPGRFGQNGIVKVVGFGIQHMVWRIYNRWGQKVFESNDPYIGWDGTYKGQLQPMDVYGYTLEVEYSDGTHTSKKGDITLIR